MLGLFIEPAQLTPVYLFYLITPNAPLFWDDRPAQVCTSVGVTDSQIGGEAERQTLNTESVICFGLIRSIGFSLKGFSVGRQYFSVISTFCQVAESARPMHYFLIVLFTFCMFMLCTYSSATATCSCFHPTGQPCSGWAPSGLWVPRSGVKQSDRPILWVSHLLLPDQNVLGECVGVKV